MFIAKRDLAANEKVVYCAKPALWPRSHLIALGILLTPIIIGIFILLRLAIEQKSTSYIVTNKRFIASSGYFSRKTESVAHSRTFGLEIDQTILGRLFNYGTITMRAPLAGEGDFSGMCISSPNKFAEIYRRATTPRTK